MWIRFLNYLAKVFVRLVDKIAFYVTRSINYCVFWYPVWFRCSIYLSIAYITTFLVHTEKIKVVSDFNSWEWMRVNLKCVVESLIIVRSFTDNLLTKHKENKVRTGDTDFISKSDTEMIKKDLGIP